MPEQAAVNGTEKKPSLSRSGRRRIVEVVFYFIVSAIILFVSAGTLDWPEAWMLLGGGLGLASVMSFFIIRKNPEVINERGRRSTQTKGWDRLIAAIMTPMVLGYMVVAGLDCRFGWSTVPLWAKLLSVVALIPGMILPYLAMLANPFLATTVRIQAERGHGVATEGPYRFVRHPMYTGVILNWLASPIFLGSWWALVPNGLACLVLLVRTVLEDRTLQAELEGYADYARNVRYRLVPRVW